MVLGIISNLVGGKDGALKQVASVIDSLHTSEEEKLDKKILMQRIQQKLAEKQLDVKLVGSIHDEYQFEVINKDVKEFCKITDLAIKDTEKTLKVRCPLDSEYKVGKTWAETH